MKALKRDNNFLYMGNKTFGTLSMPALKYGGSEIRKSKSRDGITERNTKSRIQRLPSYLQGDILHGKFLLN